MGIVAKAILVVYNSVQFSLWVFIGMEIVREVKAQNVQKGGLTDPVGFFLSINYSLVYKAYAPYLLLTQALSAFEFLQPVLGLSRGSATTAFLQFLGRSHIVVIVNYFVPELQSSAFMFVTILAWTTIEVVRYPYYVLNTVGLGFYPLTWLRYTLWIPLYPLGMVAENALVYFGRQRVGETKLYSFGVDFYFWALAAWLALTLIFMPQQLMHMRKQRNVYLGGERKAADAKTTKKTN